jgi:hypothetical protein
MTCPCPWIESPVTMPLSLVPMPGDVNGPTKSSLSGEIEMLAPESQMMEKQDSFRRALRNRAGACITILKHEGLGISKPWGTEEFQCFTCAMLT